MKTQLLYLNDPLTLEFKAGIVRKTVLAGGQTEVVLDQTCFYPTGGGQPHDTGTLNDGRVIDVNKDKAGVVAHTVDRDIDGPTISGTIDKARRWGHMQHHSAQHILSASLAVELSLETLSARISGQSPATVDVPAAELSPAEIKRVEQAVNSIVLEDRPIKSYFITDDQVEDVPFRRLPKVQGKIRVVEVEDFDYSACGGTHCPRTGMVGLIKIVNMKKQSGKLRFYFVAGYQALTYFQTYHGVATDLSRRFNTGPEEVGRVIMRQTKQLQQAEKEVGRLQTELLSFEVQQLVARAEPLAGNRIVKALYENRSARELRELAKQLRRETGVVALLAGYDGQRISLLVSCVGDTGVSAKALLTEQLRPFGGRGGGNSDMAQGGAEIEAGQVSRFFDDTNSYILVLKEAGGG